MNRVIWITGAGSGIGKALALKYNSKQNVIILSGRKEEQLNAVAKTLKNSYVLPLDVTNESAIIEAVKQVEAKFDKIDMLINNAGVSQRSKASEVSNDVGRKLMEVNFFGSVHLTKAALPLLLKSEKASIVAMSSAAGKFGFPLRSYYSASKHALHGFYEALSFELKDTNIHVLMVCPGRIKTEISFNALTASGEAHNKMDQGQLNGIPVEKCARQIVNAISKEKAEVYIGGKEVIMIYLKRYIPSLFRYIVKKVNPK
ncbi:MAG: SDR family oxidoreductase [Bacteroidia bacterium]|nr:SDR family oxidoreductase [Bacteroidia bacterium]NNJ54672.1 SDR family oxidoreductase [Bacteroidia bacterium]